MAISESNREKKYYEVAYNNFTSLIKQYPNASKYELADRLRSSTHINLKGYSYPKNTSKICENIVSERLGKPLTFNHDLMLPSSSSNYDKEERKNIKKQKLYSQEQNEQLIINLIDSAAIDSVTHYYGNKKLVGQLYNQLQYFLTYKEQKKNQNVVLISGPSGCGKTEVVKYVLKKLHHEMLEDSIIDEFQYCCIEATEILRSYNVNANKKLSIFTAIIEQLNHTNSKIILLIKNADIIVPTNMSNQSNMTFKKEQLSNELRKNIIFAYDFRNFIEELNNSYIRLKIFLTAASRLTVDPLFINSQSISILNYTILSLNLDEKVNLISSTIQRFASVYADNYLIVNDINWQAKASLMSCWTCANIINTCNAIFLCAIQDLSYVDIVESNTNVESEEIMFENAYITTANCIDEGNSKTTINEEQLFKHINEINIKSEDACKENVENTQHELVSISKNQAVLGFSEQYDNNNRELRFNDTITMDNKISTTSPNIKSSKIIRVIKIKEKHIDEAIDQGCALYLTEGFNDIPDVTLEDIGGLQEVKQYIKNNFIDIVINIDEYRKMGLHDSSGLLLYGPPGCGKTHIAKAIANACNSRFILVNGSELLDKYVGQSEFRIKEIFKKARDNSPCIIFFDEFDGLCPNRNNDTGHEVTRRVVNIMLTELDGVNKRSGVFVVAATNAPNLIDIAILRSGRFEHKLYVPLPDYESRIDIIKVILKNRNWLAKQIDIEMISKDTNNYSGADIKFILNQAAAEIWREKKLNINQIELDYKIVKHHLTKFMNHQY